MSRGWMGWLFFGLWILIHFFGVWDSRTCTDIHLRQVDCWWFQAVYCRCMHTLHESQEWVDSLARRIANLTALLAQCPDSVEVPQSSTILLRNSTPPSSVLWFFVIDRPLMRFVDAGHRSSLSPWLGCPEVFERCSRRIRCGATQIQEVWRSKTRRTIRTIHLSKSLNMSTLAEPSEWPHGWSHALHIMEDFCSNSLSQDICSRELSMLRRSRSMCLQKTLAINTSLYSSDGNPNKPTGDISRWL